MAEVKSRFRPVRQGRRLRASFPVRLRTVLAGGLKGAGIDAEVRTEAVPTTKLHRVMVIARKFKHLPPSERQDLVWRIVGTRFSQEEQLQISMIVTLTPDEMAGK